MDRWPRILAHYPQHTGRRCSCLPRRTHRCHMSRCNLQVLVRSMIQGCQSYSYEELPRHLLRRTPSNFQFYKDGIIDSTDCGTDLDHGVLVVGFVRVDSSSTDLPYFIVKNSWGAAIYKFLFAQ
mmetsp:Transcript_18605/g.15517  ORF Transcript_18605/g.15517 Transcript_18605/m.15517 type:complete len:124 (-) Transcript_18605:34-405(-)